MLIKIADDLLEGTRSRATLPSRNEWLFREADVTDDVLAACVCWEYLREVRPDHFGDGGLKTYAQELLISYRSHTARRKFSDSFDRVPLNVFFYLADHPVEPFPLSPWLELDSGLRHQLNRPLPFGWNPLIELKATATGLTTWELKIPAADGPAVSRSWSDQALQLYAFATAHETRYLSADESPTPLPEGIDIRRSPEFRDDGVPVHDLRHWLLPYATNSFASPAPFLINWAEYTQEEIIRAFKEWVRRVHPRFTPTKRQRGTRASDLGGALRDLGACRIMKAMPEQEFTGWHPEEYDLFARPRNRKNQEIKQSKLDLTKMRTRAVSFFQKYFALDPKAKPRAWQPRRSTRKATSTLNGKSPGLTAK